MTVSPGDNIPLSDAGEFTSYPNPGPTSTLNAPSHADLHDRVPVSLTRLHNRIDVTEKHVNLLWPEVTAARMVANTWTVPGALLPANDRKLILPMIWNVTGRSVVYYAAKISVLVPPLNQPIIVDIVTGSTLNGELLDDAVTDSIFPDPSPLQIQPGQYSSPTVTHDGGAGGFAAPGYQTVNTFVIAAVRQVGTPVAGTGLTIQLNRML